MFNYQRRTKVILLFFLGLLLLKIPYIVLSVSKEDTIGKLKDPIKEKIDAPVKAKDIKLWKIKIPDNHDDELANFSLQARFVTATHEIGDCWNNMHSNDTIMLS